MSPFFQLRETFKCIEHIDKSETKLKTSSLPETRKSVQNVFLQITNLNPAGQAMGSLTYVCFSLRNNYVLKLSLNIPLILRSLKLLFRMSQELMYKYLCFRCVC